jgi:four helix bundle protein
LLERLDQSDEQNPIEASIAELDAILVVFKKGVQGTSSVVRYLEHTPVDALPAMPKRRPPAKSFQDLLVWRKAHELVLGIYMLTTGFPKAETYGLSLQIRRSVGSVPANIAEGFRRRSPTEKSRFLNLAESSLEETRYFLILARDLGYGDTATLMNSLEVVSRLLNAYSTAF